MTNGNEPAYTIGDERHGTYYLGLTKREYFAAMAMANPRTEMEIAAVVQQARNLNPYNELNKPTIPSAYQARMMLAVQDADALIEALNKETK